jgi:hypothetical protein
MANQIPGRASCHYAKYLFLKEAAIGQFAEGLEAVITSASAHIPHMYLRV